MVWNMKVGRIVGQVLMRLRLDGDHLVTVLRLPSIEVCGSRWISLEEWMKTIKNELHRHLRSSGVYSSPLESWSTVLEPNRG